MTVLSLSPRLMRYLERHGIAQQFVKQSAIFTVNSLHPGLHTELLEPKHLHIYSFRITRNYRAIFIYRGSNTVEIIDINNHYR